MIFSINPNVSDYYWYTIDSKEARRKLGDDTKFHFDQRPYSYGKTWQSLELDFFSVSKRKNLLMPDMTVRNGRMFLNQKSYAVLGPLLNACGEFLPVKAGEMEGYLFNILSLADTYDAVDISQSLKNEWGELQSLGFYEDLLAGLPIFRTEYDSYMGVYCQDTLKNLVEDEKLTGLVFSHNLNGEPPHA